jgi:hypothetical protein
MYKHPKIDFLAAYNSRTGNGLVKNSVLPSAAKKEDPELLKNWRPISLLNTDYKILQKFW